MVTQLVIDIAGELGAARGLRFHDYTEAVRNLAAFSLALARPPIPRIQALGYVELALPVSLRAGAAPLEIHMAMRPVPLEGIDVTALTPANTPPPRLGC